MVQQIVYTDETEDTKVKRLAETWSISKAEAIKKIIRDYPE